MSLDGTIGAGQRLLLVDDHETMREIVSAICAELGFSEIKTARDGGEALALIQEEPFKVVLSDWNMGAVSGLDLLEAVRADPHLAGTKFVMMTARQDSQSVIAAKRAGVDGYILKPFKPMALGQKLKLALKSKPARV